MRTLKEVVSQLKSVPTKTLVAAAVAPLVLVTAGSLLVPEFASQDATVMILKYNGRGGGTGVVLESSPQGSQILTNAHVCAILKSGGIVQTSNKEKHTVTKYRVSQQHDLCLVTVSADLKAKTKLAEQAAEYLSTAKISGHPHLLPVVKSSGHFTDNQIIEVFTGVRKCSDKDREDASLSPFCAFFGGIPVIKAYETQVVTATIMAGSSGSAVYNSKGELTNLVFAGTGELSYAFTVPYSFVASFLNQELRQLEDQSPNYELNVAQLFGVEETLSHEINLARLLEKQPKKQLIKSISEICNNKSDERLTKMCSIIIRDLEWRYFE